MVGSLFFLFPGFSDVNNSSLPIEDFLSDSLRQKYLRLHLSSLSKTIECVPVHIYNSFRSLLFIFKIKLLRFLPCQQFNQLAGMELTFGDTISGHSLMTLNGNSAIRIGLASIT